MNKEDKLGSGEGGGDSWLQNIAYYTKFIAKFPDVFSDCLSPAILLEFVGPRLSVSACCFSKGVICDPIASISLLADPHDLVRNTSVARIFLSCKVALQSLARYYSHFFATNSRMISDGFPYPRTFCNGTFTYEKVLKDLVFSAILDSTRQRVVVKFTRRYGIDVHQHCATAGHAPRVLHFGEVAGDWKMVVMEFIDGVHPVLSSPNLIISLETILSYLARANFVHADLRPNNMLVQEDRVQLIDFDWSGREGEDRYPLFMNHVDLEWPEGASDGMLLLRRHDLEWVRRFTNSSSTTTTTTTSTTSTAFA